MKNGCEEGDYRGSEGLVYIESENGCLGDLFGSIYIYIYINYSLFKIYVFLYYFLYIKKKIKIIIKQT